MITIDQFADWCVTAIQFTFVGAISLAIITVIIAALWCFISSFFGEAA